MSKIKLPPEKIAELRAKQRELHDLLPEMDAAEQCGIDCTMLRSIRDDAFDKINKLIQYYGPAAK